MHHSFERNDCIEMFFNQRLCFVIKSLFFLIFLFLPSVFLRAESLPSHEIGHIMNKYLTHFFSKWLSVFAFLLVAHVRLRYLTYSPLIERLNLICNVHFVYVEIKRCWNV